MTVHVTPLHDRVPVRRLEEKEIAKGGHHHPRHGGTATTTQASGNAKGFPLAA